MKPGTSDDQDIGDWMRNRAMQVAGASGSVSDHFRDGGQYDYRQNAQEMGALRQEQAEAKKAQHAIAWQNRFLAAPALAPALTVMALEAPLAIGAALVGGIGKQVSRELRGPRLGVMARDKALAVGDNWATRSGRRAHKAFAVRVDQKPGWTPEPSIRSESGRTMRPDAGTPPKDPQFPNERYYLELKPNTASGRKAGARAVKKYSESGTRKVRTVYYDPAKYQ